jgi:DNA-binding response OmpR family regulator
MARKDFGDQRECAIDSPSAVQIAGGSASPAHRAEGARSRILIVDDNRDAADSLQMLLQGMGYDAQAAYEGCTAIKMLDANVFSVVLLDIAMPEIDGFEVARRMRAASEACPPIIAVTGFADPGTKVKARDAGILCCLIKPVEADELRRWIETVSRSATRPGAAV